MKTSFDRRRHGQKRDNATDARFWSLPFPYVAYNITRPGNDVRLREFNFSRTSRLLGMTRKGAPVGLARLEEISGYLLGNLLDRVISLGTGKSNRHINRAYVAADHLCGMRQMASACLIADADHPGTSGRTRRDVPCSNQNFKLLLRVCGFHEGAGPLGRARDIEDRMHFSSQHFGGAALGEPGTSGECA